MIDAKRISALAVARAAINDNQVQADARYIDIRLNVNGKPVPISAGEGDDEPSETELMIMADADAMQTAVKNLVENAIHYSPEHTTVAVGVGERDAKSPSAWSIRHRHPRQIAGPHFRAVLPGRPGPFARDRRFGTRLGHHQALRAGERRSDFGLVAYGEGSTFTIELPAAPDEDDDEVRPDESTQA